MGQRIGAVPLLSFGVAGQINEPNTHHIMQGIKNTVQQLSGASVVADLSSVPSTAGSKPDVFIATGDDIYFGNWLLGC